MSAVILRFPMQRKQLTTAGDDIAAAVVSRIRRVVLEHGGEWNEDRVTPKIERIVAIIAEALTERQTQ